MKTTVAVLCGGQSAEHEVSLRSAKNVIEAINPERCRILVVGIDKQGVWKRYPRENFLLNAKPEQVLTSKIAENEIRLIVRKHVIRIKKLYPIIIPTLFYV